MALSLSLGKYLLAFMEAREDRPAVYIGVFFPCHGVKCPLMCFGRRWHIQKSNQ